MARSGWRTQLTRQVGEHLVTAELGRRGYAAAPFAGNVPDWDLVAADQGGYCVPIQVKAINDHRSSWQFDIRRYAHIEIGADAQVMGGSRELPNPGVVCILVIVGTKPIEQQFFVLRLDALQSILIGCYTPRVAPQKVDSTHVAFGTRAIPEYLERWDILEEQFDMLRGRSALS